MLRASSNNERLFWREWPCPACSRGVTPFGHLVERIGANPQLRPSVIEEKIVLYSRWLVDWTKSCTHAKAVTVDLPKATEGSEHAVFFNESESSVYKLTLPGIFGDTYRIENGNTHQERSDPLLYLVRLRIWDKLFRPGPECLGVTETGQIVSRQKFIKGVCPSQEEVDNFLLSADLKPVKQSSWLWKRDYPELELSVWVGDARADNFVQTETEIIPIDLRVWLALD